MNDQDRITVDGLELVRRMKTDPEMCLQCAGCGDLLLCVQIPCNGDSYFVMVEE